MPVYAFKAINPDGQLQEGEIQANSEQAAFESLEASGKIPLSATLSKTPQSKQPSLPSTPGGRDSKLVAQLTQELMYMLRAGVSLDHALDVLHQQSKQDKLNEILVALQQSIRSGKSFSEALSLYPSLFSPLYISVIKAAEASGDLAQGLTTLNRYMENARELKEKLSAALIYPLILAAVSIISILVILLYVVPQFADILEDSQQSLPFHTQMILDLSQGLHAYGLYLLGGLLLIALLIRSCYRLPAFRQSLDNLKLHLPLIGSLQIKAELARFNRSLGTLLHNGVPLLQALKIAHQTLQLAPLQQLFAQCSVELKDGSRLSPILSRSPMLPVMMVQLIHVGEETGGLDRMLLRLADIYDQQTSSELRKLLAILEPLLIVTLGLIIALLVLSMLSAIVGINDITF